jgi:antitoxin (DNA-binding transcriptional repressor) of toxin-antitoxin stability system
MKRVGTADLKARLSAHLRAVREGETLVVLDRQHPIARIVPFDDTDGGLVIRPATGSIHDIALPGPTGSDDDVVTDLEAERAERS